MMLLPLFLQGCKVEQKVFRDEMNSISFRYPSNWEIVAAQLPATIVLLYAKDGSQATCNLSVIDSDRDSSTQFDSTYFSQIFSQVCSQYKIERNWHCHIIGQDYSFVEVTFNLQLPSGKIIPMRSLVAATVRKGKRYLMTMNCSEDKFELIRNDFEIMAGTLIFIN